MHPNDPTWPELYCLLHKQASELRGVVESPLTDQTRWPDTTGVDVATLASLVDQPIRHCGELACARRWTAMMPPMARVVTAAPLALYPDNRGFWSLLGEACADMHRAGIAVPPAAYWRGVLRQLDARGRRNVDLGAMQSDVPFGPFKDIQEPSDIYRHQVLAAFAQRGFDLMDAPPGHPFGANGMKIPRTTNADAISLAAYWTRWLGTLIDDQARGEKAVLIGTVEPGVIYVAKKWAGIIDDIDKLAKTGKPGDIYPKNNELWREIPAVANKLTEQQNRPDKAKMVEESILKSLKALPDRVEAAGKALVHAAEDAAEAAASTAGKAVHAAAAGAFGGLGTPLLIGAGLVGLYFITRSRSSEEHEHVKS